MTSTKLFWKLFLTYAVLTASSLLVLVLVGINRQSTLTTALLERRLHDIAAVYRMNLRDRWDELTAEDLQSMTQETGRQTNTRVTLVALDGIVLADSDESPDKMDNHQHRAELKQALQQGTGRAKRKSPTLRITMLYYAYRIDRNEQPLGLLRLAIPMSEFQAATASQRRTALSSFLLVSVIALAVTYFPAKHILRPVSDLTNAARQIARGDEVGRVHVSQNDELGTLAKAFNYMNDGIRQRERKLRESANLLSTVLGGMTEGVLAVDSQHETLFANSAAGTALGFEPDGAQGRSLHELVRNPVLLDAVVDALDGISVESDKRLPEIRSNEDPGRTLVVNAQPLPGKSCPGVVVVLHDVTEMRQLEQMRQEFLANVSHELKTPLSSIKAYTETLADGAIDDPAVNRKFLAQIEEQADRLHDLIIDMLRLTRIESGQHGFEIDQVRVQDVVAESIHHHRKAAADKGIDLNWHADDQDVTVDVDEEGLHQILDNLIDNAIKYSSTGGHATISWRRDGDVAIISVHDDGIGIMPEEQSRVFERFYRVDKARSRELGSTGLGLSIVKHLVHAMGGSVSLESEYGKGSTFFVQLPLSS